MATLDLQVGASLDDCMVYWTGVAWAIDLNQSLVNGQQVGYNAADFCKAGGGMRFLNVTIPQGATITTAYLTITARSTDSLTTVNSVIVGEDADNAAAFSTLDNYKGRRGTVVGGANNNNITSASVNFNSIPSWTTDTAYNSPDIKTIIQEIVNRAGWVSGNALVLYWDDHANASTNTDGTRRGGYCYDGSTSLCVKLHIEYTTVVGRSYGFIIG